MLFLRSLWKNKYYLVLSMVMLVMVARVWEPSPLIAALPDKGFIDYTELFVPFLLILPISFLLYDNFEIELGLVCGVKTAKLMLYKTNLLIRRNFARQGKASAKPDGVVTYGEGDKSKL